MCGNIIFLRLYGILSVLRKPTCLSSPASGKNAARLTDSRGALRTDICFIYILYESEHIWWGLFLSLSLLCYFHGQTLCTYINKKKKKKALDERLDNSTILLKPSRGQQRKSWCGVAGSHGDVSVDVVVIDRVVVVCVVYISSVILYFFLLICHVFCAH